jgi:hypothetical protein
MHPSSKEPHVSSSLGAFVVEKEADARAIVAFSLATEKPFPKVRHELPLPDKQRGDLYLRKVDDNGPRIIVEFKYIAVDHFVVSDGVYSEALRESVKKSGSIISWTPELKKEVRAFLKGFGDDFDLVKVNYNRKGVKTTSDWRDIWKAEAEGRVASYREAYGSAKALRVLSVTVFPTGHSRVDLVADVPGDPKVAAPDAPEATLQTRESSAMAKKAPKKAKGATKKSGV